MPREYNMYLQNNTYVGSAIYLKEVEAGDIVMYDDTSYTVLVVENIARIGVLIVKGPPSPRTVHYPIKPKEDY